MGFLQRSKSAGVTVQKGRKNGGLAKPIDTTGMEEEGRGSASEERPKTADQAPCFSRPRTANASIGRPADFQPPSFRIDFKAGDEIFSFPTPSPRLPPPKSATAQTAPSPLREPDMPAIGVAIGSPSQARPPWGRSITADHVSDRMPTLPPPNRAPPALPEHPDLEMPLAELRKTKASWKTLGGLFGRKNANMAPEEPLHKLHLVKTNMDQPAVLVRDEAFKELARLPAGNNLPMLSQHQRSPSLTRGQARFEARAEADRASFMTSQQSKNLRSPAVIQKEGLSPMFRSIQGIPEESVWVDDPRKDSPLSMMFEESEQPKDDVDAIAVPGKPTLVLDLPGPKFERYSVMFEKVFEESKPSLLERRQSRLKRMSSVKRLDPPGSHNKPPEVPRLEVNGVPERNAISPSLTKSFSVRMGKKLLSPVSEAFFSLNRPRPVQRSKTAPPSASSPFGKGLRSPGLAVQATSPDSMSKSELSLPTTPMTIATISDCGSIEIMNTDIHPEEHDTERSESSTNMNASQPIEECRVPPLRIKSPVEKQVVQVSVARQVSVSRAMTQVRESLDWKKPLRPKVVELGKNHTFVVIESVKE